MAKRKPRAKPPGEKFELLNFKISPRDRKRLIANAKKFENGNLSAWIRRAGINYKVPKKA